MQDDSEDIAALATSLSEEADRVLASELDAIKEEIQSYARGNIQEQ